MIRPILSLVVILLFSLAASPQTPDEARSLFEEGLRLMRERQFEPALAAFERSAAVNAKSPGTFANIGTVYLLLRQLEKAESAFRTAIKLDPSEGTFRSELCRTLSLQKKYSEALKECEEGVRLSPDSELAHVARIEVLGDARAEPTQVQELLDLALARFRSSEGVLGTAVDHYFRARNYERAAAALESLVALRPEIAQFRGMLAEAYLRLERDGEALAAARKALELDPQSPYGNYAMGLIFYELGQHEEANASFEKVGTRDDRLYLAEYYRALSANRMGNRPTAIAILQGLTGRYPDMLEFQIELGTILNDDSRYEEAVAPFRHAVALSPTNLYARAGLGLALFESANYEEAIPVLNEALRLSPGNEIVTMYLNVTRSRQQLIPQIDEMKRLAKNDPLNMNVRVRLIQALAFARRIKEADPYTSEFLAVKHDDVTLYQRIAVAYGTAGMYEKAEGIYKRALTVKEDAGTYFGLAEIAARLAQREKAIQYYSKCVALRPDASGMMHLFANHLRASGKRREALEMYKRSLAIKPLNAGALSSTVVLSAKLNERENALQYLAQLRTVDPVDARRLERALKLGLL